MIYVHAAQERNIKIAVEDLRNCFGGKDMFAEFEEAVNSIDTLQIELDEIRGSL
jgi:hypothetical protein